MQVIEDTDHNNLQAKIIYLIFFVRGSVCVCVCVYETQESVYVWVDLFVYVCTSVYCNMLFGLSSPMIPTCVIWALYFL